MNVFRGSTPFSAGPACALTIGNFDGVHRGHHALLKQLVAGARERDLTSCVLTFEPHPKEFFSPKEAPPRILNLRDKLAALADLGIDRVVVEHFNSAFARLSPEEFVSEIIVKRLNTKWILIGDDFCYGAKRAGNFASLKAAGEKYGFEVSSIQTILEDGERISSSALRSALANGDMKQAEKLLGRPYAISGHVIHGQKLGRKLGFPTLNLAVANHLHHRKPATTGIFTAQVLGLGGEALPAVASLGVRPTVEDEGRVLLETHIFDYQQDVYGKIITVELLEKIRDEEKYDDLDTLTNAIAQDAKVARNYFQKKSYV
ncbi:bifunctional riboflavin kinase/FAD synthetase [Polynucleobacter sp. MWH-UH2A]|uniref:bifunctional riboflavin kinase/FAD synthetase n=1 Tax=Polynucleobacter sp. MWH-UH2A TaxID=1855617 RepID=UPI001BFD33F0|nr:bifunctional riboflavin kinase/FAD synthetase [Polynucleobacter sp. MWH-UH2A]QWD63757.1 bifunctional riboflavin kinase/FAD synthetase [Polynucleobacter sp. MWH-UH2A]